MTREDCNVIAHAHIKLNAPSSAHAQRQLPCWHSEVVAHAALQMPRSPMTLLLQLQVVQRNTKGCRCTWRCAAARATQRAQARQRCSPLLLGSSHTWSWWLATPSTQAQTMRKLPTTTTGTSWTIRRCQAQRRALCSTLKLVSRWALRTAVQALQPTIVKASNVHKRSSTAVLCATLCCAPHLPCTCCALRPWYSFCMSALQSESLQHMRIRHAQRRAV